MNGFDVQLGMKMRGTVTNASLLSLAKLREKDEHSAYPKTKKYENHSTPLPPTTRHHHGTS